MNFLKRHKKVFAFLLLILFLEYFCGSTLFVHTHSFDGWTVTHSHPYSGSPAAPGHTHTAAQLQAIALLSLLEGVLTVMSVSFGMLSVEKILFDTGFRGNSGRIGMFCPSLRAPPVTMLVSGSV